MRQKLLLLLITSVASMSLGSCSCSPAPVVATVITNVLVDVLFEFATATIPLKKFGRAAALLSVSGGKAALKIETEIGKSGIKVGGAYPILDLKAAVAEAYRQTHKREPPQDFGVNFSGSALVVVRGAEKFIFFIESTSYCVANIDESSIVSVDHEKRIVSIEVSEDLTDVSFATTAEGCATIAADISERKRQNAVVELKNILTLLDLKDGVISLDPDTGKVEIEYQQGADRVKSIFNPRLLKTKHGISTKDELSIFRQAAQNKIDYCSEAALKSDGNDTSSLKNARAECLTQGGYGDNDQIYFKATGMLST
jgi:hypothetical protein